MSLKSGIWTSKESNSEGACIINIADTIIAKSDQLNAEDLISGPITVTITSVKRSSDEQPVIVEISGGHKPWKPCKSMRRLLIMAWPEGAIKEGGETRYDPSCWVGRSVTLVRDPNVRWAGELVGGIRVSALSHIKTKFEVALAESKKKKKLVMVDKLETPTAEPRKPESATSDRNAKEPTLVDKYAKRLNELKTRAEIEAAYLKFEQVAPTMDDAIAQQIYQLFANKAQPEGDTK